MKKGNMYQLSVRQWNPFVGCLHGCVYCKPSFQAALKRWAKKNCELCYEFKPHIHPERLTKLNLPLPKTDYMQFIFTCSHGDVAFCHTTFLQAIIKRIEQESDRTFLIQSKDPATFSRVKFPSNVILGTTIETNKRWLYCQGDTTLFNHISNAPHPSKRFEDFKKINHKLKMVTVEPILDFEIDYMVEWITALDPVMVWMGYDSKNCKLPEPSLREFRELHWRLSELGFFVILKTVRKAWWEK